MGTLSFVILQECNNEGSQLRFFGVSHLRMTTAIRPPIKDALRNSQNNKSSKRIGFEKSLLNEKKEMRDDRQY